jgi:hypothetical protein
VPEMTAGVTCEGVRALRIGMSKAEVVTHLGEPAIRQEFGRDGPRGEARQHERWNYAGGDFVVEFGSDETLYLASADLGKPHLFADRPTSVFILTGPGKPGDEGEQFNRFFRCPPR